MLSEHKMVSKPGRRRRGRVVAGTLALALIVAACSDDSTDDTSSTQATSADSTEDTSPAEPTENTTPTESTAGNTAAPETTVADSGDTDGRFEASAELRGLSGLTAEAVVTAAEPVTVVVVARSADHTVDVPRTAIASLDHSIPVVGMRPDRDYEITVTAYDEAGAAVGESSAGVVHTEPLPPWMPANQVTVSEGSSLGYTLVETAPPVDEDGSPIYADQPAQVLVAYDDEGEIVWYYTNTGAIGGVEQTEQGTYLSHYWPFGIRENDVYGELVGHWRPQPASAEGDEVDNDALVDAVDPDVVEMWVGALEGNPGDMDPLPVAAEWVDLGGFHHENWPIGDGSGNVLALSTTVHELTDEQRTTFCPDDDTAFNAISDVVVEYEPDGTAVRTWDLWDAIDVDDFPGPGMCIDAGIFAEVSTRDWTHANSVVYDERRDAIIVSSRHTDQIVAFDHLDDAGPQTSIRWILGAGSTMPFDGELSYHQHAVEVIDDTRIIIYDNGNFRPGTTGENPEIPPYSRAVIYDVDDTSADPADWSARQTWEHIAVDDEGTPIYTSFIGDADYLDNGNVLITHGGIGSLDPEAGAPLHALIIEVVPEGENGGEIVWEFRSDPVSPNSSYRSERIESFYVGDAWES